jgi:hypothetical protein
MYYDLTRKMYEDGLSAEEIISRLAEGRLDIQSDQNIVARGMLQSIVLGYYIYFQRQEKNV